MNRDAYIKRVVRFIEKQLASNLDQLPSAFEIAGVHGAQTDWKLTVELQAIEESEEGTPEKERLCRCINGPKDYPSKGDINGNH